MEIQETFSSDVKDQMILATIQRILLKIQQLLSEKFVVQRSVNDYGGVTYKISTEKIISTNYHFLWWRWVNQDKRYIPRLTFTVVGDIFLSISDERFWRVATNEIKTLAGQLDLDVRLEKDYVSVSE